MDWLKDKKNQPIVAAILAAIIVGAGVLVYFTMFAGGSSDAGVDASGMPVDQQGVPSGVQPTTTTPAPVTTMPAAPTTGAPATTPGQPAAAGGAAVAATPLETWRGDPFLPVGYKPPSKVRPNPPIRDFPYPILPHPGGDIEKRNDPPDKPQPVRRLAGVMLNGRVFAIIESNGKSDIVQPGEPLEDGLATVERIEADKVILKTIDKRPRYLVVRLASAPKRPSSGGTATPNMAPVGPGPYLPGGRGYPGPPSRPGGPGGPGGLM